MKRRKVSGSLRFYVFKRDNYKCLNCGAGRDEISLHLDHIVPVSSGGSDDLDNLQTLCKDCNFGKRDKFIGMSLRQDKENKILSKKLEEANQCFANLLIPLLTDEEKEKIMEFDIKKMKPGTPYHTEKWTELLKLSYSDEDTAKMMEASR